MCQTYCINSAVNCTAEKQQLPVLFLWPPYCDRAISYECIDLVNVSLTAEYNRTAAAAFLPPKIQNIPRCTRSKCKRDNMKP